MKFFRLSFAFLLSYCTLTNFAFAQTCSQAAVIDALQQNNIQKLSKLFHYPLRINLRSGTRSIISSGALIDASKQLFTPEAKKSLIKNLQMNTTPIHRSNGIGLADGNIWLDPQDCKIMALNAAAIKGTNITPNPLYGSAIKPIYSQSNQVIYYADIDNSGTNKIIIATTEGSMHDNAVTFIGEPKKNALIPISLDKVIKKNFKIQLSNWYYFFADAFLTYKNGKVYMNYSTDGISCTYLWKDNLIKFVSGNRKYCIH